MTATWNVLHGVGVLVKACAKGVLALASLRAVVGVGKGFRVLRWVGRVVVDGMWQRRETIGSEKPMRLRGRRGCYRTGFRWLSAM
jgi:hypothetical protein